jgi:hypothetical protein
MHHDLFLTIEVDALLNWIDITSRVWERNESVVYQMHSADCMNLIHQCLQCLTSLIMSFKCTTIIFEKLKKTKLQLVMKYVLWRHSASYLSIISLLPHLCCSCLNHNYCLIFICTMTNFRPLLTKCSSDTLISTSWNLWARKKVNTWFKNWYH